LPEGVALPGSLGMSVQQYASSTARSILPGYRCTIVLGVGEARGMVRGGSQEQALCGPGAGRTIESHET
jgi:hypothetical protein